MPVFSQAFPLVAGSKRPACKWASPATCRPSDTYGSERYGLATGPRNGVWVLDLDVKNSVNGLRSLVVLAGGREIPATYTVRTPSGGLHLYWLWHDESPVGNHVALMPGVDVRGVGGYVCAGGDYRVEDDMPVVDAPAWLLEMVTSRAPVTTSESAVAIGSDHPEWEDRLHDAGEFLAGEPPCVSGQGGQAQIWKCALRLMRTFELPVDAALEVLAPYNARCVPPWSEAELRHNLVNASEKGQGPTGTFRGSFLEQWGAQAAKEDPPRPKVPGPMESEPWRQVRSASHEYFIDVSAECAGAMIKTNALGPKELTGTFAGPGAPPLWRGVWQYDAFRSRILAVNPPMPLDAETRGISKRDLAIVQVWMACQGGKASTEMIQNALDVAAAQASFHPVRDYLDALPVMPRDEADAYFQDIAGRLWQGTPLESSHVRRLAIAAVRRVRVPGTKVDTMLVLAGEQGFRKSLMCAKLFGDYFLDQLPPVNSGRGHEASIAIEGRWGVEVAEMNAFASVNESAKKEFLTRCVDKYRPVFGVAVQEVPRQCVFIGTTNDDDFLTDPTGNTRYDICDIQNPIDLEALDRDVFWAAANALEASGEAHWRDRAVLAREAAESAEPDGSPMFENGGVLPVRTPHETASFASEDLWTSDVLKWSRDNGIDAPGGVFVTAKMVIVGLAFGLDKQDGRTAGRVKGILRTHYGASHVKWLDGRPQRCYRLR